jgi:hypothetical protein
MPRGQGEAYNTSERVWLVTGKSLESHPWYNLVGIFKRGYYILQYSSSFLFGKLKNDYIYASKRVLGTRGYPHKIQPTGLGYIYCNLIMRGKEGK